MNSDKFYYKIDIDDRNDYHDQYVKEQIKRCTNAIINTYSTEDQNCIFFETDLQNDEVQEKLSDLSIHYIGSSSMFEDDKIIVYFTMIPKFLQNEQNFNTLIQSFLGFFKLLEIIPSILYCVRCQNPNDAKRLIAFTREIYFIDRGSKQPLIIDSNILNLPIMQVFPRSFSANYIHEHYNYNIMYSTIYEQLNILVFDTLQNAEAFSNQCNGTIIQNQMVNIRHFVDNTTYQQLEKYQLRFKIPDLLQSEDVKNEDLKEAEINRICYSILRKYGKILLFEIDKKNHINVIFENKNDAVKIVKNQKIKSQFVNNSLYICGFPPDMTKDQLKSLLAKSSIILNNMEDYVLESSDSKDTSTKKITFPVFKIHFSDIGEVDSISNKIKKINFDSFVPFLFRNKDDFKENFNQITSNNTLLISGLTNNSTPSEVAKLCQEYGIIKLFLHIKMAKNSSAIATFSKSNEFEVAKKNLKQVVFSGNHLNVRKFMPKQTSDSLDFKLIKKSTSDLKKQQISQKAQNPNDPNKKASKQANKAQENKKAQNNQLSQQNLPKIKVEKSGEAQKQIKLEYNKSNTLKLEPLPPRILKDIQLSVIPKNLGISDDDFDFSVEQKPDFI